MATKIKETETKKQPAAKKKPATKTAAKPAAKKTATKSAAKKTATKSAAKKTAQIGREKDGCRQTGLEEGRCLEIPGKVRRQKTCRQGQPLGKTR